MLFDWGHGESCVCLWTCWCRVMWVWWTGQDAARPLPGDLFVGVPDLLQVSVDGFGGGFGFDGSVVILAVAVAVMSKEVADADVSAINEWAFCGELSRERVPCFVCFEAPASVRVVVG